MDFRLRVAFDARLPPRPSGIGLYTQEILEALARRPSLAITAISAPRQPLPEGVARLATKISFDQHGPAELFEHVQLPRELDSQAFDLLHGPNSIVPLGRTRFARVVTLHDVAFSRFPETLTPAFRLLMRVRTGTSLAVADAALAVSRFTAQELTSLFPRLAHKIAMVPSATPESARRHVRDERRASTLLAILGLESRRYVCAIGTLEPRKNLVTLLQAFAQARVPGLKLALIGDRGWRDGPLRRELAQIPADAVILTGWLEGERMRDLVGESAGLLYPSLYEGFGFPPLEALALGVPAASADLPPIAESCAGRAMVLSPRDVGGWARALLTLVTAPRPARWVGRTFDDVAEETEAVYRDVLNRRGGASMQMKGRCP
jgi:glycosyltransferase involved in cell wall biosynthesis